MTYALFKDGKQVSKAHASIEVVRIEAFEAGAVIDWGADFVNDLPGRGLACGYEIKQLSKDGAGS